MKAWLFAQDRARQATFGYQPVFKRSEASEMSEHDAHELMRAAEDAYRDYTWSVERVGITSDLFVVEGTLKQK
jgi:hypothetical protein